MFTDTMWRRKVLAQRWCDSALTPSVLRGS